MGIALITNNILSDSGTAVAGLVPTSRTISTTAPLTGGGDLSADRTFAIPAATTSVNGYLSSVDWTTFNAKQVAGNYIVSLTGEATATGPGAAAVTLNNASVTGKVLTGVNITGGTVLATDTMLTAFGKLQNQINGLIGSTIYQGVWNANTNTPTLTSSVGTNGFYYIVNVAGSTNLDGITDWKIGDWAIFNGGVWQKVDNTEAVTSVNGFTGAVSLTTDNVAQGTTNLYFANSLARAAISLTVTGSSGASSYNNTTGVLNVPTYTLSGLGGQPLATNLTSLSGLTFASTAFVKMTAAGTFALDTTAYGTGSVTSVSALTLGTTGTDLSSTVATGTTTPIITLNVPTASAANRGALSAADWTTFNNKASTAALANYLPLAGGTLTGALSGTSATFSDTTDITANNSTAINLVLRGRAADSVGQMEFWNNAKSTRYGYIATDSTSYGIVSTQAIPLVLGTNSAERMRITSSGEILIGGTLNPYTSANRGNITLNGTSGNVISFTNNTISQGYILHQANSFILFNEVNGPMIFGTNNTQKMRIEAGGNVLVGTTTDAGYKLDVNGTGRFSGTVYVSQSSYTFPALSASYFGYSASYNVVILGNTNPAQTRSLAFGVDVSANASGAFSGYGNEYIWRNAGSFITPNSANTAYNTLFSWNSSGSLTVNQAATFSSSVQTTNIGINFAPQTDRLFVYNASGTNSLITAQQDGTGDLIRLNGNSGANRFVVQQGGNVGIGTTSSPSAKLDVRTGVAGTLVNFTDGVAQTFQVNTTSTGIDITNPNSGYISFSNTTERMRITSGGNVLIGTTTDSGQGLLQIGGSTNGKISLTGGSSQNGMRWESVATANTFYLFNGNYGPGPGWGIYNVTTAGLPFWIQNSGAATFGSSVTATSFFESSSVAYKNILATNPVTSLNVDVIKYKRTNVDVDDVRYGYSAEQINSLMPELTNKEATAVKYLDVHTLLIAELQREIKELKAKLN